MCCSYYNQAEIRVREEQEAVLSERDKRAFQIRPELFIVNIKALPRFCPNSEVQICPNNIKYTDRN